MDGQQNKSVKSDSKEILEFEIKRTLNAMEELRTVYLEASAAVDQVIERSNDEIVKASDLAESSTDVEEHGRAMKTLKKLRGALKKYDSALSAIGRQLEVDDLHNALSGFDSTMNVSPSVSVLSNGASPEFSLLDIASEPKSNDAPQVELDISKTQSQKKSMGKQAATASTPFQVLQTDECKRLLLAPTDVKKVLANRVRSFSAPMKILTIADELIAQNLAELMGGDGHRASNEPHQVEEAVKKQVNKAPPAPCSDSPRKLLLADSYSRNTLLPYMSLPVNEFIEFEIAYIESPSLFWIHTSHAKDNLAILREKITASIADECGIHRRIEDFKVGDYCAVPSGVGKVYERAQILEIRFGNFGELESDGWVKVHRVDVGDVEWVSLLNVAALGSEYGKLVRQAMPCVLAQVAPMSGTWTESNIASFRDLCSNAKERGRFAIEIIGTQEENRFINTVLIHRFLCGGGGKTTLVNDELVAANPDLCHVDRIVPMGFYEKESGLPIGGFPGEW